MVLHVVSTGRQSIEEFVGISTRIHPYVDTIHIREKHRSAKEIAGIIDRLTIEQQVPRQKIIVNDRVDVAFAKQTKGVQLAHHSLDVRTVRYMFPKLEIGCSVHSPDEAVNAERNGASYLIYGHIFETNSKPDLTPHGIVNLETVCETSKLPVIAIGGIRPDNVKEVLNAGASGIAVMSGVFEAKDPLRAVQNYYSALHS
ncbi:thiazole tautomerase TenI [Pseudalkalibacillus decolorationis]|uniref:thiazole tautomerase TenI n=1 Tax=Pseudalkalibacillus decolorationis TaxID=163879 RepID=UPI0021488BAC|nr:thiazole tautomerase TenI [Pseudalkalibacillus decolorationis]